MGGTTIRRLIGHKDFTASVQRFVIPAADVSRASILANQPNEVEHAFAWIEYVDSMSERICQTNNCLIESVLSVLAAQAREYDALNEHARCNGCISTRDRLHAFAFHETCRRAIVPQDNARVNRDAGER